MFSLRSGFLILTVTVPIALAANDTLFKIPILEAGEIYMKQVVNSRLMDILPSYMNLYSPLFYIQAIVLGVLGYFLYGIIFRPIDRIRVLGDVGYRPDGKFTKKEIARSVKKRRVVGEIPPVYPNGWFGVIESWKLKREPVYVSVLGEQLVVFRDEKGEAHILDAYCPHMGANLGVGGRVVGDCIECPFHGWKFRGYDGKCTEVPYSEKVPDFAKIKAWTSAELNGWVHIWYHAEGVEPTWKIPELKEITSGTWQFKGRTEHYINAHIEEIPENGADVAHLKQVHEPLMAAGTDLTKMWSKYFSWGQHIWQASWHQLPSPDEHVGCMTVDHDLKCFGFSLPFVKAHVTALQIGPGIVYLTIEGTPFKGAWLHYLTPVEPMVQKLVHNVYMHWSIPNIIAKFFMYTEAIQIERDMMIWNNKKFQAKPVFTRTKEDSLISKHRRWYSQFYSEHSPRLNFQKDTLDW
ncbi:cholesterol 7-desaturase nvd-like [Ruditapes philippinarum]|uniref:cholesterol 7-desaturase nvd-like n=1 Tax=Ruditapes philippinarum TaxID=129788 RepID=UPI00295B0F30|nr:cholesterol 7-desaturase nvd-like [Ruditapes philippinarum]